MRIDAGATRPLAAMAAAFTVVYYAIAGAGAGELRTDLLLFVPPAIAVALLLRATGEGGRARWFWRLLALGPALWLTAEALWTVEEMGGGAPRILTDATGGAPVSDLFYIGFLVPMIGAVGLRPHPRPRRRDPVALADAAIVTIALCFVFLRVVLLPLRPVESRGGAGFVLGSLCLVLSAWTAWLWRRVDEPAWRRTYGAVSVFAFLYGTLSAMANGLGRQMLPLGGPLDVVWFVPFFVLAAAATEPPAADRARHLPSAAIVVVAGTGPWLLDQALRIGLPALGLALEPQPILLLAASALLAIAWAARLLLEERIEAAAQSRQQAAFDEARRAGRLGTLAALSAGIVQDLEQATDEVAARARAAAPLMGPRADSVVEQAERARGIVRELAAAFRVVPAAERRPVDPGRILEDTVRGALDEGLPLRVRLEETGRLPEVMAEAGALGAAFLDVIRNAAQASPGGVLAIGAATDGREVVLRFRDDGPGVSADIRGRIFDPFFTTRRVGDGVGLGLTHAHFVARDHGGSVVLEPPAAAGGGASFVFRLPARERRAARPVPDAWPLSSAALLSAAAATTLSMLVPGGGRAWTGLVLQIGAAALAALALGLTAAGAPARGRARWFWGLLAAGPALWALGRVLPAHPGAPGPSGEVLWRYVLYAAAELAWVAALLLRPDRRPRTLPSARGLLAASAVLGVFAYLYAYLVVLPAPYAQSDLALDRQMLLLRGLQRAAIVAWAFLLARTAVTDYWRIAFGRLGLVFAAWAAGQTAAGYARHSADRAGSLADLGGIVPFLLLAALAVVEGRRHSGPERHFVSRRRPFAAAIPLLTVAALPVFDALVRPSAHSALDVARASLTTLAMLALAAIFVLRELLAARAERAQAGAPEEATLVPRFTGLVASAMYELGGQLSGIAALARLVLAQSDLPASAREDARRIRGRGDAALRIVSNVLVAVRGVGGLPQAASVNAAVQEAIEERGFDLAEEDIRLHPELAESVPPLSLNMPALRQALLCCIDAAAVGLRAAGAGGTIELVTGVDGDEGHVVVGVRAGAGALPPSALRQLGATPLATKATGELDASLGLAREIVSQLGGTLTGHNRRQGGTELWIRLPMSAATPLLQRRGGGGSAP